MRNTLDREQKVSVSSELWREQEALVLAPHSVEATLPPASMTRVELNLALTAKQVSLWQLDSPVLYQARTTVAGRAEDSVRFGLRRFEARGTELLLNGHPIRLAGQPPRQPSGLGSNRAGRRCGA